MTYRASTTEDRGYTVERCKSGLGAASALSAGGHRHYEERARFWEAQLRFAEAANRHDPPEQTDAL